MKNAIVMSALAITMSLSSCGIFQKESKTDAASSEVITGKKWKLIELNGKPVADKINGKEPFLKLDDNDKRYSASGGCNGIGGSFTLSANNRINFSQGMSTMMACQDMATEQELAKILEIADNYNFDGKTLKLNKARMVPLAEFEIIK